MDLAHVPQRVVPRSVLRALYGEISMEFSFDLDERLVSLSEAVPGLMPEKPLGTKLSNLLRPQRLDDLRMLAMLAKHNPGQVVSQSFTAATLVGCGEFLEEVVFKNDLYEVKQVLVGE